MATVTLLINGEWKRALESVDKLPVWNLLPEPSAPRAFMKVQIQREGLRANRRGQFGEARRAFESS